MADFEGKAIVLAFIGVDCPLANLYIPRLIEMHQAYADKGVQFLAVYPNRPETLEHISAHAYERSVPFPVLKDFDAELADSLGVSRTPTVVVLNSDHQLCYRGRIDDQFAVASRRSATRHHDLRDAIDAVLQDKPVERAEVASDGCPLNRAAPTTSKQPLTYHEHVASIIHDRCVECHRPGQIGPMPLLTYDDVVDNAESIAEVIEQRRMPPWHADGRYGHFANNRRLSDDQLATLLGWFEQDMPEGQAAADVKEVDRSERRWNIQPDVVFRMPEAAEVPADGVMPYQYYLVPTNFEEDRWVVASEALPGNPEVVHHVIVYFVGEGRGSFFGSDLETQILAIGGPGEGIFRAPEGTALRLPKGTELLFEMHYQPNGLASKDLSEVGIVFTDQPPERELRMNMFGTEDLNIPAHDPHYAQEVSFTFDKDGTIYSLLPHMHWRGKAYSAWIEHDDGRIETLLTVPRYDFNWQTAYRFAQPLAVKAGTTIHSRAHWDNSANNLANPDPTQDVHYGIQTSEEMMFGFLSYAYDEPVQEQLPSEKPNALAAMIFKSMDKNSNGLIEPSEMPERMRKELLDEGMQINTSITPRAFRALMMDGQQRQQK